LTNSVIVSKPLGLRKEKQGVLLFAGSTSCGKALPYKKLNQKMPFRTRNGRQETKTGIYQLLIYLPGKTFIMIGKKGTVEFPQGYYIYTGSAKNGLEKRLKRHIRKDKKLFWHIDYLLEYGEIKDFRVYSKGGECELNRKVLKKADSKIILSGFGSSDCRCPAHLLYFENKPKWRV
jgi:Uri superfamily endonuclease